MDLESRGLPSGFVASCEFEQAADAQGKSLGIKPARVFVPHPIQDANDDEMKSKADGCIDEVIAALIA